jgi:signal transduction histidine kinase
MESGASPCFPFVCRSVIHGQSTAFRCMKKSLLVLLLAVLLPSLLLGWLALRSAQEQQIILERRTAELYQKETDNVATTARSLISEQRRIFAETLRQMLAEEDPQALAAHFTSSLKTRWPQPAIGFALNDEGRLLSPTSRDASADPRTRQFLYDNSAFLGNKTAATAYPVAMDELNRPELSQQQRSRSANAASSKAAPALGQNADRFQSNASKLAMKKEFKAAPPGIVAPGAAAPSQKEAAFANFADEVPVARNVAPQQQLASAESQLIWATAEFRQFIAEGNEGVVNRFVQDRLNMIFWVRPAAARNLVFGCLLRSEDLREHWPGLFEAAPQRYADRSAADPDFILALLDDKAQPAALSPAGSHVPDWKKPFVASEIGEALPHWEAALYLRHPERLQASAQRVRRNLYLLIFCALGAIGAGGWVIFSDTRNQLALAQKKTDFVSNVSHELKTPLTSIRMFAEMMHSGRAAPERQPQYLRIIMVEAERLTRLINNVLDFARLERRERRLDKRPMDLHEMLTQTWPAQELHLREAGFTAHWESASPPYPVIGDEDALAQVLVNLLSNAEKYGGERKEITLHSYLEGPWVCMSILDRGPGVPPGEETKIFEPFYRAHDSLSSGIPGTGLGLALARRVIHEHDGEIFYQSRPGGGSNFTVRLPLSKLEA